MSGIERSFLLVKPNMCNNPVVHDEVLTKLSLFDLRFTEIYETRITEEEVYELCPGRIGLERFDDIKAYLTSGPVRVIKVEGHDAIQAVRDVKGKTWRGGLRGKYAKDFVENAFHSPDSAEERDDHEKILERRKNVIFDSQIDKYE
jgi:nucleoside-diphosphate kinase